MAYTTLALSALPKRKAPEKTWDAEAANALLGIISTPFTSEEDRPTATDGVPYADQKAARSEANKAKRLVNHVVPDGKSVTSIVFGLDKDGAPVAANADGAKAFGWALVLKDAPVEPEAAKAAKGK